MAFPLDLKHLSVAEHELGRALPEPLRKRLQTNNGGEIDIDGNDWTLNPNSEVFFHWYHETGNIKPVTISWN